MPEGGIRHRTVADIRLASRHDFSAHQRQANQPGGVVVKSNANWIAIHSGRCCCGVE
jgi:hypothetical protein